MSSRMPLKSSSDQDNTSARHEMTPQTDQPLASHAQILHLQRTIGNRATVQRLKISDPLQMLPDEQTEEQSSPEEMRLQRTPLMSSEDMLQVSPYTTNIFGQKKATAYNTLVDALKDYKAYIATSKRNYATLEKKLDAVVNAAHAWVAKHGASTKSADVLKQPAVHKTLVAALKLQKDMKKAFDDLTEATKSIDGMYQSPVLWARIVDWSREVWHLDENTRFYHAVKTMTSIAEGKKIIADHLVDQKIKGPGGNILHDASPDLFNVSGPLFAQAKALIVRPDTEVTVEMFKALFEDCIRAAGQVWNDLGSKTRNDTAQTDRDSFVFNYIVTVVPDLVR